MALCKLDGGFRSQIEATCKQGLSNRLSTCITPCMNAVLGLEFQSKKESLFMHSFRLEYISTSQCMWFNGQSSGHNLTGLAVVHFAGLFAAQNRVV